MCRVEYSNLQNISLVYWNFPLVSNMEYTYVSLDMMPLLH